MCGLLLRLKQRKFNKDEWENDIHSRKYFYRNIIKSRMLIGKNVYECGRLLGTRQRNVSYGDSWKMIDLKEWKYIIYKTPIIGSTYSLAIYFENGKVYELKLVSE